MMNDVDSLLVLTKSIVRSACKKLCNVRQQNIKAHQYSQTLPREMKAAIDQVMEDQILPKLEKTGLPILSEEGGEITGAHKSKIKFIVDPLDGTVNFIRGLGPASISIALVQDDQPVFGVLGLYPSGELVWGGKSIGAFIDGQKIQVSKIEDPAKGVICTGFPARYNIDDVKTTAQFVKIINQFAKVRMLGAASISLLRVAQGAAEMYNEKDIMLWDVAAGLAIVDGAGGRSWVSSGNGHNTLDVVATNGLLNL